MTSALQTYRVSAYNTARQSENKMHDDTVARRFGFSGGLVPGVVRCDGFVVRGDPGVRRVVVPRVVGCGGGFVVRGDRRVRRVVVRLAVRVRLG